MRGKWWGALLVVSTLAVIDCGGNAIDDLGIASPWEDANGGVSGNAGSGGGAGSGGSAGSGGTTGFSACTQTSDCLVRPADCCGNCGAATRGNAIAINRANANSYTLAVCENSGCPACYMPPDPTLQASCANGVCEVLDLRTQPFTACSIDQDCQVRWASCCQCGTSAPDALIALRTDGEAEYERLMCNPGGAGCNLCLPSYPEMAVARCFDGRCSVTGPARRGNER